MGTPSTDDAEGDLRVISDVRVIIAAAGPQKYWDNYLGVPSHMAPVEGLPLLHRTIGQVASLAFDIHVLVPAGSDDYPLDDAVKLAQDLNAGARVYRHEIPAGTTNEYRSSEPFWNNHGRTILLLGDVYFTDAALISIMRTTAVRYHVFGRYGKSSITGTPYGEIFAASWHGEHNALIRQHLTRVETAFRNRRSRRQDGWALLRSIQGTHLNKHIVRKPYFVEINDETDDMDKPADYDRHPAVLRGKS